MNLQRHLGKKPPGKKPPVMPLIDQLAKEGLELLQAEGGMPEIQSQVSKDETKKLEVALGESSDNPYIKARTQILKKMNQWQQAEIARMEKDGDINNRHYDAFVRHVREKGDELSSKK